MKNIDLGSPIIKYQLKTLGWKDLLRVFLPLLIVVLAPTIYGFWRTIYGYSNYGPAAAAAWGRNWFLLGGILLVFLLLFTLVRLIKAHTWVEVYRWGITSQIPPGRKRFLSWEEIFGITSYAISKSFLGIKVKTKNYLLLHTRKHKPIKVHPGLKDQNSLKKTIKKQVYGRLKPKLMDAFSRGEILPFGDVSISKHSLFLTDKEIPWEFIDGIVVQKGKLIIKLSEQKNIEVPIRKIINLEILFHIIKTEI
jgi:hypothetical protein